MHRKKYLKVVWEEAPDVGCSIRDILTKLGSNNIIFDNLFFYRSFNSSSNAYARIWGLPRLWQKALKINPSYIIEVISEKFDNVSKSKKDEILIHEISHIPKNFSGSLLPHIRKKGKRNFKEKLENLINIYNKN